MPRFLRLLMVLAMLLSPLAMAGGAPAQAAPGAAAAEGHCADSDRQAPDEPGLAIDCALACSAIPAAGGEVAEPLPTPSRLDPPPSVAVRDGLEPEAAIPPPRSA